MRVGLGQDPPRRPRTAHSLFSILFSHFFHLPQSLQYTQDTHNTESVGKTKSLDRPHPRVKGPDM